MSSLGKLPLPLGGQPAHGTRISLEALPVTNPFCVRAVPGVQPQRECRRHPPLALFAGVTADYLTLRDC